MDTNADKPQELMTEQEARKALAEQLGCKPEEIEVCIDQNDWADAQKFSFYVQRIDEFDGPTIQIKLPYTRFLVGGLSH